MSDQLLPDFDGPGSAPEQPSPRKSRPRPQRKRPAKKIAKRAVPAPKAAKRVPKKRRVRKTPRNPDLKIGPPRLVVMFDVCTKITDLLKTLSDEEREAVMQSVMFST